MNPADISESCDGPEPGETPPVPPIDPLLRDAFAPSSGTAEQWNEAYARLSDYFRAHRIHSRLHRTGLVLETLRRAAATHSLHPEFTPTQVAIHEARRLQKKWLRDIVGDLKLPEDRLEANGRVAFLMSDGPRRWPDYFLKRDNIPADMIEAVRRRVEQSGPDLAVSSMVPREIELGFFPEMAEDTFEMFEKYPMLRILLILLALTLAVFAGVHLGARKPDGDTSPVRARQEPREPREPREQPSRMEPEHEEMPVPAGPDRTPEREEPSARQPVKEE